MCALWAYMCTSVCRSVNWQRGGAILTSGSRPMSLPSSDLPWNLDYHAHVLGISMPTYFHFIYKKLLNVPLSNMYPPSWGNCFFTFCNINETPHTKKLHITNLQGFFFSFWVSFLISPWIRVPPKMQSTPWSQIIPHIALQFCHNCMESTRMLNNF